METFIKSFLALMGTGLLATTAFADKPHDWQIDFQQPVTPVMEKITEFHDLILVIQFGICAFVGALILYIIFRFRASRNPTPTKTSHNSLLEVIWTLIPVVILIIIVVPSMRLLYFMDVVPKADMTIKAIGNQWYWTYEYPDEDISFDSMLIEDQDLKPGQMRLFEVDNRVVVPTNTVVRLITTSNDVLHSWAVPSFGVKKDSVPGRLNETWFKVEKEGTYRGQCSELCGAKHGFMPIVVEAVSPARYQFWVASHKPEPSKEEPQQETVENKVTTSPNPADNDIKTEVTQPKDNETPKEVKTDE